MFYSAVSSRRRFLAGASAAALGSIILPRQSLAAPIRGGTLVAAISPEPVMLNAAVNPAAPDGNVTPNIFDGLLTYDFGMIPRPSLAIRWEVAEDGLSIKFWLRQGVKWHDGQPFTSADVKFSLLSVWKTIHPRGRANFAAVTDVDTPDDHTVVLRLKAPAPVILSVLNSYESQVLPKHLYEGTDFANNPYNLKPVGTGPFIFKSWERGSHIILERNPDYWDAGKPHLDRLIYRIIPDATSRAALLEKGEVQYAPFSPIPLRDVERFRSIPSLVVETKGYEFLAPWFYLEFNLRNPVLADVHVRRAFAHAIDRDVVAKIGWYGLAQPAAGPIPSVLGKFYTADAPSYAFDPVKAEALLDQAGHQRGADGIRFKIVHDYLPYGEEYKRVGEYVRQALKRVGINVELRAQDAASFFRRVYTDNDFELSSTWIAAFADPQVGVHRLYWSKGINKGTPLTNASGYSNPETDAIIEASQTERDPIKRIEQFHQLQRIAQRDLPLLNLVELNFFTVHSARLKNAVVGPDAIYASLKEAWLES